MRQHLFLLRELVRRDFHGRYAGSVLSFLWSFVQPLWQLLLFTFVFSVVLKLKLEQYGVATDNFGIFLFCGLLPWTAIHESLLRSTTAVIDNAPLVKKLSFPAELLIVSIVGGALLHEAIAAAVFAVVLAAVGEMAWASLPWLLLALPLQIALSLGLSFLLASLHVFFRDTAQVLGMLLTGWFYLTPIVYPLGMVPASVEPLIRLNPLTALVELYRAALLGGNSIPWPSVAVLAATASLALAGGYYVFHRLKPAFVDEI